MFSSTKLDVKEAIAQAQDDAIMRCAMVAYEWARSEKGSCEECFLKIADSIRALMRSHK